MYSIMVLGALYIEKALLLKQYVTNGTDTDQEIKLPTALSPVPLLSSSTGHLFSLIAVNQRVRHPPPSNKQLHFFSGAQGNTHMHTESESNSKRERGKARSPQIGYRSECPLIGNQKQWSWKSAEKEQWNLKRLLSVNLDHDKKGPASCVTI